MINDNVKAFNDDEYIVSNAKRKRIADPDSWHQNVQKKKRSLGEEYEGKKLVNCVWTKTVKPKKEMGDLCRKDLCKKNSLKFCLEFSEENCWDIFNAFWNIEEKKGYESKFANWLYFSQREKSQENTELNI